MQKRLASPFFDLSIRYPISIKGSDPAYQMHLQASIIAESPPILDPVLAHRSCPIPFNSNFQKPQTEEYLVRTSMPSMSLWKGE